MKKSIWILAFALLVMACNNSADNKTSADTAADLNEEEIESVDLQASFPDLFAYLKKQDTSLNLEKFSPAEASIISGLAPAPLDEDDAKNFKPYFIYNPDSSLAIDLYSYNHFPREKEGKTVLEMAGPDSEVALVDFDKKTRQRLMFTGPSLSVLDARWTSPKEILLAGAEQINDQTIKPMLWKINLVDSSMISFDYSDTLNAKLYDYVEEKFKE